MKLSKAQEWVMQKAYSDVDKARACETYEEYFINVLSKDFGVSEIVKVVVSYLECNSQQISVVVEQLGFLCRSSSQAAALP
mgnify:CR=1 FL=1